MPALVKTASILALCGMLCACGSLQQAVAPSIEFTTVPRADEEGQDRRDLIEGRVRGQRPGEQIVIYAKAGPAWWAQPLLDQPFTNIDSDSRWSCETHLGVKYAALLVDSTFRPRLRITELPKLGGGIAAITMADGTRSAFPRTVRFSGYDWQPRAISSNRGGATNEYSPSNVWTDSTGALHLRVQRVNGKWICSEVQLTRSLGYGTYSFVVQDTSALEPAAVFGMFTWDVSAADPNHRELDIELSRWGDPASKNAQYVVQPYYIPANVVKFEAPSGLTRYQFRWEQGRMTFKTIRESKTGDRASLVTERVFTSGVPSPGMESVHVNLYVFSSSRADRSALQHGAEVVLQKFEYLP